MAPSANDGLKLNVRAQRRPGADLDIDGKTAKRFQLPPAFLRRPQMQQVSPGELRYLQSPPFLHVELLRKIRVERIQKSELPIEIVRQFGEHCLQVSRAVLEAQQLAHEYVRAALIDGLLVAADLRIRRPA